MLSLGNKFTDLSVQCNGMKIKLLNKKKNFLSSKIFNAAALMIKNLKPTFKNHHDSIARPAYLITLFLLIRQQKGRGGHHINKKFIYNIV